MIQNESRQQPALKTWSRNSRRAVQAMQLVPHYEDPQKHHEQTHELQQILSFGAQTLLDKLEVTSKNAPRVVSKFLVVPELSLDLPVHTQYGVANKYSPRTAYDTSLFQEGPYLAANSVRFPWSQLNAYGVADEANFGVPVQLGLEANARPARIIGVGESDHVAADTQLGSITISGVFMLAAMKRLRAGGVDGRIEFPQIEPVDINGALRRPAIIPVGDNLAVYGSYPDANTSVTPPPAISIPVFG